MASTTVETITSVTLTLTEKEARALHSVLRAVGGTWDESPRKEIEEISASLRKAGIGYNDKAFVGSLISSADA